MKTAFKIISKDVYQTGRLRRSTLVSLRWLAIAGQLVSLAIVHIGLGYEILVFPCLLVIGFSALMNIIIMQSAPLDRRIGNVEVGAQLLFDVVQLSALLFLTGGMNNPFVILLLAPAVVAAKTLNKAVFVSVVIAVTLFSFALLLWHFPLPWAAGSFVQLPRLYQYGTWIALFVGMLFTSSYTWRATAQTRRMTRALAASEAILFQEKKLSALGGLAAAAAHELGTPLATIQITAKEIARNAEQGSELYEDADLLLSQTQRCRNILKNLANHGEDGDVMHDILELPTLLHEITEPFIDNGAEIVTKLTPPASGLKMPVLQRHPEFVYGLTNIVENASDFAQSKVEVNCTWDHQRISIEVVDDGLGFDPSVLGKIGEPYISYRPSKMSKAGGLGLGVFIAKTLIERMGGRVEFKNCAKGTGAHVQLCWPYV